VILPSTQVTTDAGHWLKVSARADGSFSVTNGRTGETKACAAGD
jgi:hypothetical protein